MKQYIERLYNEWLEHHKIIIAVDYDDTIFPFKLGNKKDIRKTIKLVKKAQEIGAYVVIFTASDPERHESIKEHCKSIDLHIDSINKNPIKLPYGKSGKIYYNINLCDRSGLQQSLKILKKTIKKMNKILKS
jgi:hypothetical protein